MRQRQRGCLEIVDDLNRLQSEPIPHVSTINGPRAVGEIAALALYRSSDGEQCVDDSMIVRVQLQEVFDGVAECRMTGDFDPLDRPEHSINKNTEPGVRRADVAEQHSFSRGGHRYPIRVKFRYKGHHNVNQHLTLQTHIRLRLMGPKRYFSGASGRRGEDES